MSEWKEFKLGEIIEICSSKRIFYKEYVSIGIPFYRSKEIIEKHNGKTISTDLFITQERFDELKIKFGVPQKGDILLTSVGTLGVPYIVQNEEFYFKDGNLTWFKNFNSNLDSLFLYYYLLSPRGKGELEMSAIGSTQPALTISGLRELKLTLPPLPEQQAIAEVLSSLDDKIDLLHRQNQTLEQMAETLFRQWFIEEAKEEWKLFKIKDIAIHKKDSVNPSKNPFGEYKHFSLPAFDSGKKPQVELGNTIHSNKYRVHKNSILVSKLNPRIPRIWLNLKHVDEMCICSTEFQVIHPNRIDYLGFLFCLLKSDDAVAELEMSASGTSGSHQRVRPEDILNLKFSTPSLERVQEFSQIIEPLLSKNDQNLRSIINLEKQRDTLLPKLMSGEVRVKIDKE